MSRILQQVGDIDGCCRTRPFVLMLRNSMSVTVELIFRGTHGPVVFMNHMSDVAYSYII